jgi:hypothetical protein
MEAARPVAALAARLSADSELAEQLVHAAHENDTGRMEKLFREAGVHGAKATIDDEGAERTSTAAAAAARTRTYGITVDVGPVHFSIKVEIKK